jgi:adenosylmethionine-8-amino-7-oxononanoate aminotransferase
LEAGIMIHPAGDTIQLMQPLIISEDQIVMDKVRASIKAAA